jgi:hypothetical protein
MVRACRISITRSFTFNGCTHRQDTLRHENWIGYGEDDFTIAPTFLRDLVALLYLLEHQTDNTYDCIWIGYHVRKHTAKHKRFCLPPLTSKQ